jgi:hypothetical protein
MSTPLDMDMGFGVVVALSLLLYNCDSIFGGMREEEEINWRPRMRCCQVYPRMVSGGKVGLYYRLGTWISVLNYCRGFRQPPWAWRYFRDVTQQATSKRDKAKKWFAC